MHLPDISKNLFKSDGWSPAGDAVSTLGLRSTLARIFSTDDIQAAGADRRFPAVARRRRIAIMFALAEQSVAAVRRKSRMEAAVELELERCAVRCCGVAACTFRSGGQSYIRAKIEPSMMHIFYDIPFGRVK